VFAAPDLLLHYINKHNYLPPREFLEAIADSANHPKWKPDLECAQRLDRAFWE